MPNWWMQSVKQTSAFLNTFPQFFHNFWRLHTAETILELRYSTVLESQLQDLHLQSEVCIANDCQLQSRHKTKHLTGVLGIFIHAYTALPASKRCDRTVTTEQNRTFTSASHSWSASATVSTGARHTETSTVTQCTDLKRKIHRSMSRGLRCLNTCHVPWSWRDCCVAKCMQKQSLLPTKKQTMRNELPLKIKYYMFIILI